MEKNLSTKIVEEAKSTISKESKFNNGKHPIKNFPKHKVTHNQKKNYQPKKQHSMVVKRGDVFFADMGQGSGSEQEGVRPVVILQNDVGNRFSSTVIVACITSQIAKANLPTHVEVGVEHGLKKQSVVLLEQIRTIDKQRLTDKITKFDDDVMQEIDKAMMISLGLA